MKKKIALFLAAVMALGPVSVFAASDNDLVNQPSNVTKGTVMFENGSLDFGEYLDLFPDNNQGIPDADSEEKFRAAVNGPDLQIEMRNNNNDILKDNDVFKVDLVNAEWFFRNTRNDITLSTARVEALLQLFILNYQFRNIQFQPGPDQFVGNIATINSKAPAESLRFSDFEPVSNPEISANEAAYIFGFFDDLTVQDIIDSDPLAAITPDLIWSNYITANGGAAATAVAAFTTASTLPSAGSLQYADRFNTEGYRRFVGDPLAEWDSEYLTKLDGAFRNGNRISTYNPVNGIYIPQLNTYYSFDAAGDLVYSLRVEGTDRNKGVVRMYQEISQGNTLFIPVVARAMDNGEVKVQVARDGNYTSVSATDLLIATVSGTKTNTYITEKINSKYSFTLNDIEIKELNTGSIRPGRIEIKAPDGFYFSNPDVAAVVREDGTKEHIRIIGEGTLRFSIDGNTRYDVTNSNGRYVDYGTTDGRTDTSILVINTGANGLNLVPTTQTAGKMVLKNIVLLADDYAPMGDVVLKIEGTGVTEQDFTIGTRADWGVEFKTLTEPTKLVNGRLQNAYRPISNNASTPFISNTTFDSEHKTAKVKFSENVVASWWGLRESEFTLPAGVKFMQVKIAEEKNLDHVNNNYKLNGEYPLTDSKTNYVTLNANKLKINDVQIKRDKTASFEMQIWVSIESGWEGDIMLTAGGNDILKATTPLKIATAVSPITVKAEVKDVKIGYQWQKVADVVITETDKGMLQKDKQVVLSIDDNITGSDNIAFAPDFVTEVNTDSNIAISKPVVERGTVKFTIERASTTKPASIKFSNMYVKIDRTVPETNKRPYSVVVGGTAVAANYYENQGVTSIRSIHPLFAVKGIGADYLNVVTSATNASSLFSNVVRVTIGSNEIKIGRDGASQTLNMDTAAYISTTNSTMVPVRFVSQAFGLPDSQILWDDEARTVTILGGPNGTVQMKAGSDQITVGGATYTMYSPDNPPIKVAVEIKDNRAFLPFRQLGNALGVEVSWDDATKTAIYNPQLLDTTTAATTAE